MTKLFFNFMLSSILFGTILTSCTKEDVEQMECESQDIGYVTITNTSENPYKVSIDGSFVFNLEGNTFKDDYELSSGSHTFKAEQISGYLVYPTVREATEDIGQCDKKSWVFP